MYMHRRRINAFTALSNICLLSVSCISIIQPVDQADLDDLQLINMFQGSAIFAKPYSNFSKAHFNFLSHSVKFARV